MENFVAFYFKYVYLVHALPAMLATPHRALVGIAFSLKKSSSL
jgi:hypothetical protein